MAQIWLYFLSSFVGAFLSLVLLLIFFRPLVKIVSRRFIRIMMSDRYAENVFEMVSAVTKINPRLVVENSLRAETGRIIERPFGSPRKFLNFDGLVFSPAQLAVMPAEEDIQVDTTVTIGPKAKRPLKLELPLLLGGMGYGIGISKKAQLAMAMGTKAAGTAMNIGEGGFLQEVRDHAGHFIMQYHSGKWGKDPQQLKQADAIEIHIGQGASAAAASRVPPEFMQGEARDVLGLQPDETAILPSRYPGIDKVSDFKKLVNELRQLTSGVPIGMKITASHLIEQDIEFGIKAGIDFVSIDGGQAGTKGAAPVFEDDFGLPTIYALSRAVQYLKKRAPIRKVSVMIGGGFTSPGDCLKALALGADAVFLGTAALWAMTHLQVNKMLPFEPPTHLIFYSGKYNDQFDEQEAAMNLERFFNSFAEEMKVATLALGKTKISDINPNDLVALDDLTSKVTNIPTAYGNEKGQNST